MVKQMMAKTGSFLCSVFGPVYPDELPSVSINYLRYGEIRTWDLEDVG